MEITGTLTIQNREETNSRANRRLRREGSMPGNVFARGMESIAITVKKDELWRNISKFGRTAVYKLKDEKGEIYNVMVKDIQNAPVTGEFLHVDFQQISLDEEVRANVPLKVEGKELLESRRLLMMLHIDHIPVKGLPNDIPNSIDVDVSEMDIGDSILVSDIVFPKDIEPDIDIETLLLTVSEAKIEIGEEEAEVEEDALETVEGAEEEVVEENQD